MSKISQQVLEQIKDENLKPYPKWLFILWHVFLIISLLLTVVLGGFVMALVFLHFDNIDWEFVSFSGDQGLPPFLEVLPFLWLSMLIVVNFLALKVFSLFEQAYKHSHVLIVLVSIGLSILLGWSINHNRGADFFEQSLRDNIGPYAEMQRSFEDKFLIPEKGLLPGRVIQINSSVEIELEDLKSKNWTIHFDQKLADKKGIQMLQPGQMVMVVGKIQENDTFLARDIRIKRIFGENLRKKIIQKRPVLKPQIRFTQQIP